VVGLFIYLVVALGSLAAGGWVIGHWSLVIGHVSCVIGQWSWVIGHASLVIGLRSLVIGHWSLVLMISGQWSTVRQFVV